MSGSTEDIQITTASGDKMGAYLATPEGSGPFPAVIVWMEIFGVNDNMRQIADRLAGEGFVVYVPDLFWRFEPRIELDPDVEEQFQTAIGYYQKYSEDDGVKDLQASVTALRNDPDVQAAYFG